MFKRGLALSIALGLFTAVEAQTVNITLVPDVAGPYEGGEIISVDVNLTLTGTTDKLVRLVQLDLNDSHPDLLSSAIYPPLNGASFGFWDFSSQPGCPTVCGVNHFVEPIPTGTGTNIGTIAYQGLSANANEQILLTQDVPVRIGRMRITLPLADGDYPLDVASAGPAPDEGASVAYGFGVLVGDDLTNLNSGNGGVTGGSMIFTVGTDGCETPGNFVSSLPASGGSMPRTMNNYVEVNLDASPSKPVEAGDIKIFALLDGGGEGPDLSGSFAIAESGGVITIEENGGVLTHNTWYKIQATGQNDCIDFSICLLKLAGNADGNNFTNFADLGNVFSGGTFPITGAAKTNRRDVNGDTFVNFADLGATNTFVPSTGAALPSGHTCP